MIKLKCKWCGQPVKAPDVETAARSKCPLCSKELLVEFSTIAPAAAAEDLPEAVPDRPRRTVGWLMIGLGAVILVGLVGIVVAISYREPKSGRVNPDGPAISISAVRLQKEYKANKETADANYKDQRLLVTGTIHSSGRNLLGKPYVAFETQGDKLGFNTVTCFFDPQQTPDLDSLEKGRPAAVEGICTGASLTDIELRDCRLVWLQ